MGAPSYDGSDYLQRRIWSDLGEFWERLSSFADSFVEAVVCADVNGKVVFFNRAAEELFGYSSDEVLGQPVVVLVPEDKRNDHLKGFEEMAKVTGTFPDKRLTEVTCRRRDGSTFPAEMTISCWSTVRGPIFYSVIRDTSERRKTEEALRESEEKYRRLVEASPDAIFVHVDGKFVYANPAAVKLVGARVADDIIGSDWTLFLHPDYRELVEARVRKVLQEGRENPPLEQKLLRLDGGEVIVECTSMPFSYQGRPAVLVIAHDLTQRRKTEEALRESEERFRSAFEGANIGMSLTDMKGNYIKVNRAFSEMVGHSVDEMMSMSFTEITHPDDLQENLRQFSRLASGEIPSFHLEKRYVHRDGHIVWASVDVSAVRNTEGRPLYALAEIQDITLRKLYEEELARSEERYRTLFEQSPISLWEEDFSLVKGELEELKARGVRDLRAHLQARPDFVRRLVGMARVVDVNEASVRLYGAADKDELRRQNFVTGDEALPAFLNFLMAVAEGRPECQVETSNRRLDGETFWVSIKFRVAPGYEVSYGKVFLSVTDITERVKAEEEVRRSEERYRTLFDYSPISLWVEDYSAVKLLMDRLREAGVEDFREYFGQHPDALETFARLMKVVDVNRATLELYRAPSKEALAPVTEFSGSERRAKFMERLVAFSEGKRNFEAEVESRALSGERLYVRVRAVIAPGSEATWKRVFVSVMDLTARVNAERALRESEERFRLTFEHAGIGMAIATPDGKWVKVNPSICRMLGYTEEEALALGWPDTTYPEDLPLNMKLHRELLEGKRESYQIEKRHVRKDGLLMWGKVTVSAVRDASGRPLFTIGMMEDVTERKLMEEELRKYSSGLEAMVEERTRELEESHRRLLQAERMAAIGTLAAMVGHDLRNPLTTINTNLYYLTRILTGVKDRRVREAIRMMGAATQHANKIIEDLLEYSRSSELMKVKVSIDEAIREAVKGVRIPKRVRVTLRLKKGLYVDGDSSKLVRVFQNLVANAVDAMPGGGRLLITSYAAGSYAVVEVADTGVGISEEGMRDLFKPLYTTKAKGLGMGLAICKRLVEAHGGTISVRSRPNEGSVFTVTLPLSGQEGTKAPRPGTQAQA